MAHRQSCPRETNGEDIHPQLECQLHLLKAYLFSEEPPVPADPSSCAEVPWVQEGHHIQGQEARQHRSEVQPSHGNSLHQQIPAAPEGFKFSLRNQHEPLREDEGEMTHLSWQEVHRPSRDDMRCFLCPSVHKSNQRSTRLTLSSNSWSPQERR